MLQEWQRARNPSNKARDVMLKLGTLGDVPRQVEGKKRPPAEVAQAVKENMLKKAKKMLSGSVAEPAPQSDNNRAEASALGSTLGHADAQWLGASCVAQAHPGQG